MPETYRRAKIVRTIEFEIVTLVGESSHRRWGLNRVHAVLGYQPRLRLDELGYVLVDENVPLE